MDFSYGPLAPDQGENSPGVLMQANGCIPLQQGYGPFPQLVAASGATALSGAPRGMFSYQKADNTWKLVAGTATTLEIMDSAFAWSAIDTGLAPPTGSDFSFERYGDFLTYTNTVDGLRAYNVESGGAAAAVTAAGKPRSIFECGDILFGLDCENRAGARDNKLIRSCKRGDHTAWTGVGTDYQPLQTGGSLIWGGKLTDTTALVLQQREVRLIQVGGVGTAKWGQVSLSKEFGSVGARSVVAFDGSVYWLATDGFRRYSGSGLERIGAGLIDQWFLSRLDQSDMSLVQGVIDPFRKCVLWRYKTLAVGSTATFQDIIGFHWPTSRWFTLSVPTSYLVYAAESAVTWNAMPGTWDSAGTVWDARSLQGGQSLLGALDSSYVFNYFVGANMAATIETSVADLPVALLVNWCRPIDDAPGGTISLGVKDELSGTTTWKTGVAKTATGWGAIRGRGRAVGFRRAITAGETWTYARGIKDAGPTRPGPR